jgi:prolipoprotein diacylglyceryltransferase
MWFRRGRTGTGKVAWLYLALYAAARFVIEFFRGDNPQVLMRLTLSQVIGVLAMIAAVPLAYVLWLQPRGTAASNDAEGAGH